VVPALASGPVAAGYTLYPRRGFKPFLGLVVLGVDVLHGGKAAAHVRVVQLRQPPEFFSQGNKCCAVLEILSRHRVSNLEIKNAAYGVSRNTSRPP
jgi:hypothetical protein